MHLHKGLQIYLMENSPPPSIKLLAADQYVRPSIFLFEGSDTTLEDISIGSLSLQAFVDGNLTRDQLWLAAQQNPIKGEWEVLGDYVFSRRFDLYDQESPNIIVGLCLIPHRDGHYQVIYADNHTEVMASGSGWMAAQNTIRASQGLEPLPDLP